VHRAVGEGHDPGVAIELGVEHETGYEARMHGAEIAHGVPDVVGGGVEGDVFGWKP